MIHIDKLVILKNNNAVCDSLQIAEKFNKNHQHVLRDIDKLTVQNRTVKEMFHETNYKAVNGQMYRKFYINRDGFSLLVMSFTGKKALEWKLKYIQAFNLMENIIKQRSTKEWIETRQQGKITHKTETDAIKELVEYAIKQGSSNYKRLYETYAKLANGAVGISKRDEATTLQLNNLLLIENIISNCIYNGMNENKHYKDIYKDCKIKVELFKGLVFMKLSA